MASRILGESETHTSQPEPLPAAALNIQTQHTSWFYFPFLVKYQVIFSAAGDVRVHPKMKRAETCGCHIEGELGMGGWEIWDYQKQSNTQRTDKQQSPNV